LNVVDRTVAARNASGAFGFDRLGCVRAYGPLTVDSPPTGQPANAVMWFPRSNEYLFG
jgi:hypothetical protein